MNWLDYVVLIGYFAGMLGVGWWSMRRIKAQEDYFMGGRSFGKIIQAFAAFGAGTGSSDPVNTARTSFTSGMSGIWSTFSWLFVTPFYWFTGVWYRRMRHLTLGDWFVERYNSKGIGAAYTIFGIVFYMVYISMLFSAIGKVAAPLLGDTFTIGNQTIALEYVLVPIIALIVIGYGVLGGITAAYWTDVIQGIFIILLSILLIPFGLKALVNQFGDPATQSLWSGFQIMHQQLPESMFTIVGSSNASEFPLHRIIAVTIVLLIGIVVQPHFIATGGGTAKSEYNARVGLVLGNFAKRFCTIGWALTALIVLALYADNAEIMSDPDKAWGVASRELLWPGLRGLMLACLLAALMSSADCYMLVSSALVVRNIYAPFVNPEASEKQYLKLARWTGAFIIFGAVLFSWSMMDVFRQLQLTWVVPLVFAAPFWLGMFWRRATTRAAWITITFSTLVFFLLPWLLPNMISSLRTNPGLTKTNPIITTISERPATPVDVRKRRAEIDRWEKSRESAELSLVGAELEEKRFKRFGARPEPLEIGAPIQEQFKSGGKAVYWSGAAQPLDGARLVEVDRVEESGQTRIVERWGRPDESAGEFKFRLFYL